MTQQNDIKSIMRPLAQEIIDYTMQAGKDYGVSDVKVSLSADTETSLHVEGGEVSKDLYGASSVFSMTIYAGDKVVSFSKDSFDSTAIKHAIDENLKIINLVPENPDQRLLDADKVYKGEVPDLDLYDTNPPSHSDLVKYAVQVEKKALAQDNIKTTRDTVVSKNEMHRLALATNGLDQEKSSSFYTAYTITIAEGESGMQTGYASSAARHFKDLTPAGKLGVKAGKNAAARLNPSLPQTGEYPIVLDKSTAAMFFQSVLNAIDGTAVYRGATFLKDELGKQVMHKDITIEDCPRVKKGLASSPVDGAGLESHDIKFIEAGVLKQFNMSVQEARKLNREPIGRQNGTTNVRVHPGQQTPEDLMKDIKEGIYIEGFNGGTVNISNGTHSRQAYGKLIKDGKVTDIAVEGFVVSGNLKDMFMNAIVANDTPKDFKKNSFLAPTTRINGLTIAGK